MRMIEPITVTPGMLTSSTVPENDHPAWAVGTTYAQGARVTFDRRIWESVQNGNTGNNPGTDATGGWWVRVEAVNRWRAFDNALTPLTAQAADITYVLTLTQRVDSVAMFGLIGSSARITIKDTGGATRYDKTFQLASGRVVKDWWDWFFAPFALVPSLIAEKLPGYLGWTLTITIAGTGTRAVGEILIGNTVVLGKSLTGTEAGFRDFSVKEKDQWGNWQVVERGYSSTVDYRFALPDDDVDRVKRTIARNRARLCVFSTGTKSAALGTTILGFINQDGLSIPISGPTCFATLSVEGVTEE